MGTELSKIGTSYVISDPLQSIRFMRARFTIIGKTLFPALNVRTNTNSQVPWPRVTGFLSENPAGASPQGFLSSRRAAEPQRFLED